ncbi:hypothetical protein QBC32DRAFT_163834 [Pseudoneurospora amorphoporcata]|uniref:RING-type domain-containing protein n=1 Tax=Pseudoneurospora amorphoporcata TaxID=241081 RepID=A0AAN6P3H0_9PEZI|nr:hypothetical protein QBC32DRAFT_163834 [Pseudoneurospora amorphoporcata]
MSRVLFGHRALAAPANKPLASSKGKNSGWTERVKEKQVEAQSEEETDPADKMCPICHEEIGFPSSEGIVETWSVLPCGHMFGSHCIKHYIQMVAYDRPQCPMCRYSLVHGCGHPVLPALFVTEGRNAAKINRETIRALVMRSLQYNCAYCTEMIASGHKVVAARHVRKRQRTSRWKLLLKKMFSSPVATDRRNDAEYATARFETRFERRFDNNWNGARDYEWEWWWDRQALTSLSLGSSTK